MYVYLFGSGVLWYYFIYIYWVIEIIWYGFFVLCVYSIKFMIYVINDVIRFFFNEICLFCCFEVFFRVYLIKGKEYFYIWYKFLCLVNDYELGF